MAKLNRTCGICKRVYSYCPTCAADAKKPTWMAIFCSENCKGVYDVINDYRYNLLSKEDSFNKLITLDLSHKDNLPTNFKQILDEIFSASVKEQGIIAEEMIIEEIVDEVVEENKEELIVVENNVEEISVLKEEDQEKIEESEIVNEINEVIEEEVVKPKSRKKTKNVE